MRDPEMEDLLDDIESFLDDHSDVDDGTPNDAMRLLTRLVEARDATRRA